MGKYFGVIFTQYFIFLIFFIKKPPIHMENKTVLPIWKWRSGYRKRVCALSISEFTVPNIEEGELVPFLGNPFPWWHTDCGIKRWSHGPTAYNCIPLDHNPGLIPYSCHFFLVIRSPHFSDAHLYSKGVGMFYSSGQLFFFLN